LGALNVQQQDAASQMTMAGWGFFFDVRARKTHAHHPEPAMFLALLVMAVVGDRLEIRGVCELKHCQASWRQANLGQCSVEKLASVSFFQRIRKMP
jgi:hypothetical protein